MPGVSLGCHDGEWECSWRLTGTDQRCCLITYNAQDRPSQRTIRPQMPTVLSPKDHPLDCDSWGKLSPLQLGLQPAAWTL